MLLRNYNFTKMAHRLALMEGNAAHDEQQELRQQI